MFTIKAMYEASALTIGTGVDNNFSTIDVGDHVIIVYCFTDSNTKIAQQQRSEINMDNKAVWTTRLIVQVLSLSPAE